MFFSKRFRVFLLFIFFIPAIWANTTDNQTDELNTVLPQTNVPFSISIEQAFTLPVGLHSGAIGFYKGRWVIIAGRTDGLHGFNIAGNFPVVGQNTSIYVVDPSTGTVNSRSLREAGSGLNQQQIDILSVTSPEFFQEDHTLYLVGGYGIDTASNSFTTKNVITALYLPGIVEWVLQPEKGTTVSSNIRQIFDNTFQVTGGRLFKLGNVMQLVFGQDFVGDYTTNSNGTYTEQVRRFRVKNVNGQFAVDILSPQPSTLNANFRRRDLNVVPTFLNNHNQLEYGLIAYAGVFTANTGVWTVPVIISTNNEPIMPDPNASNTFKQAMNQYICATASLYSRRLSSMFHIFFGGLSYGYFSGGVFSTDSEIPFINQVTTVQIDKNGNFTQYLMNNSYPIITSKDVNPGNTLLFGTAAYYVINNISQYANLIVNLDNIRKPTVIGYIVGGIMSTLANTNTQADSTASPYVFKVVLTPNVTRALAAQSSNAQVSRSATH